MKFTQTVAVVFGSALTSPNPRDVDVAFNGNREAAADAARVWAAVNNIDLVRVPLDLHEVRAGRELLSDNSVSPPVVYLPSPMGRESSAESLLDPCVVRWTAVRSLSAVLRALGDRGERRAAAFEATAALLGYFSVNLAADNPSRPLEDWDDYVNGQRALGNAVRHVEAWRTLVSESCFLAFVDALVKCGPSDAGVELAARHTSGGQAKLYLHCGPEGWRATTQYGAETWTLDRAEAVFLAHA